MTTIKDIADIVGVSTATVSYVLNGKKKVSKETELKVMQAVKQMDYTPNLPARSLRKNKTNLKTRIDYILKKNEKKKRPFFFSFFFCFT